MSNLNTNLAELRTAVAELNQRAEEAEAQVEVLKGLLTQTEAKLTAQVREKGFAQRDLKESKAFVKELRKTIREVDSLVSPIERR